MRNSNGSHVLLFTLTVALLVAGCAGPMTSTAVLQERRSDGGTVRIVCPGYPPDIDTQTQTKALIGQVCGDRSWKIVDMTITDIQKNPPEKNSNWVWVAGYGGPASKIPPKTPDQQVDLKFACVSE